MRPRFRQSLRAELRQVVAVFKALDVDGSGALDYRELVRRCTAAELRVAGRGDRSPEQAKQNKQTSHKEY